MLAIPVLAGAGSAGMAGLLGKRTGFSNSPRRAPVFYGLCAVGTVAGTALSLLSVNPIKLLVFVAVVNGVAAAPFIIVTMFVSSDQTIMGEYVNGRATKDSRMDNRDSDGRRSYSALCNGRCLEPLSPSCSPMTIASPHAEPFDDSRSRDSDRPPRRSAPEADPTKPPLHDAITRAEHAPAARLCGRTLGFALR
jgi:hypothetical protein